MDIGGNTNSHFNPLEFFVWCVHLLSRRSSELTISSGAIFIYIAAASPNRASLGATNGISQMTVSIFRAIGPAAANSLFSLSLSEHYMGGLLVYYVLMATTVAAIAVGSLLPRHARRP